MRWSRYGVEGDFKYFMWGPLKGRVKYFGLHHIWYDGPHYTFGFWFFNINWRFRWCGSDDRFWRRPWIVADKSYWDDLGYK